MESLLGRAGQATLDSAVARLSKIIGIYRADRGLVGHLRYAFDSLAGGEGCALCDITHSVIRTKADFKRCKRELSVPLEFIYQNEMPEPMRRRVGEATPALVGVATDGSLHVLLGPSELADLQGDVGRLFAALETALADRAFHHTHEK